MAYCDEETRFDGMTDEEVDEFYRPKKANSRKALLSLYVYLVLKAKTDSNRPMSQTEILDELYKTYELCVERKALSRTLHSLVDEGLGIVSRPKVGSWYDEDEEWNPLY